MSIALVSPSFVVIFRFLKLNFFNILLIVLADIPTL